MKKCFYLAVLALGFMASCSSDDAPVVSENIASSSENGLVPIQLGVGNPLMSVSTRGAGTVGSDVPEDNKWHSEHIRVLMTWIPDTIKGHEWGFTQRDEGTGEGLYNLFGNQFYCLPNASLGTYGTAGVWLDAQLNGNITRYYPQSGNSNFFAYFVDDAIVPTDTETSLYDNTDVAPALHDSILTVADTAQACKYINFVMDGTQDIMAGMAPHNTEPAYLGFSAKAARHGVHPNIKMDHLLTRLTFKVVPGHANAQNVKVKSISVESPNEGTMFVAYNANTPKDASELITWTKKNEETDSLKTSEFFLQEAPAEWYDDAAGTKNNLVPLTPFDFNTEFDWASLTEPYDYSTNGFAAKPIGEAMFVAPGLAKYPLHVVLDNTSENPLVADSPMDLTISLGNDNTLQMGYSYEITIVIYGLSDIKVYATLTDWQTGEPINIGAD